MSDTIWIDRDGRMHQLPQELGEMLAKNSYRRDAARRELDAARDELRDLLVRGRKFGFTVSEMCETSGISRDTAHRLLRDA